MDYRQKFTEYYNEYVRREGAAELLERLEKNDFFTAPASTRFHCACPAGLVQHSVNVFEVMREHHFEEGDSLESFAICGLLHDICKAQFYKVSSRNVKNDATGQWEKATYYMVEDQFPYGHGEKSVYLISQFMKLTVEEAMAIRWHMGGFDDSARGGSNTISIAFDKYPLAVKLHLSDLEATYLREHGTSVVNKK